MKTHSLIKEAFLWGKLPRSRKEFFIMEGLPPKSERRPPFAGRAQERSGAEGTPAAVPLRNMYAISVEITSANRQLKDAQAYLADWIRRHVRRYSGDHADLSKSVFEVNRTFEQRVYGAVASSRDGRRWAARLQHPQEDDHRKVWRTEMSLDHGVDDRTMLAATVSYSGERDLSIRRRAPSFIRGLQKDLNYALFDEDELSTEPWCIEAVRDVDEILELIADPDRVLPVIVVSEPSPLSALELAQSAFGYAHTIALPASMTDEFRRAITLPWSVYGGAIRTYPAGLDLAAPDAFIAPVASRGTIQDYSFANGLGPGAFREFIIDAAAAATARRLTNANVLLSYSEVRRESIDEVGATIRADSLLFVTSLKEERDALIARVTDLEELSARVGLENAEFESMYERMDARVQSARHEIHALVAQSTALQEALKSAGKPAPSIPIPETFDELDDWARTYFAGRLLVTPRALKGAGESIYPGITTVYNGLRFLGDEYHAMRIRGSADGDVYDPARLAVRVKELGFRDLARSAGETTYTKHYEEYHVTVFGDPVRLEWHLRKGRGFDGRECVRIYFGWHDVERVVVVGWMTTHLPNSQS
jgi:hypothetical protein